MCEKTCTRYIQQHPPCQTTSWDTPKTQSAAPVQKTQVHKAARQCNCSSLHTSSTPQYTGHIVAECCPPRLRNLPMLLLVILGDRPPGLPHSYCCDAYQVGAHSAGHAAALAVTDTGTPRQLFFTDDAAQMDRCTEGAAHAAARAAADTGRPPPSFAATGSQRCLPHPLLS